MANGGNFLTGYGSSNEQLSRFSPQNTAILNQLAQQGSQNANFQGIEDLARKNFQQKTIPSLAERFTAMSGDTRGSSAFQGALGQAGSDLESQLAGLRSQFGMQQLQMGLQPGENMYTPAGGGMLSPLASGLGAGAGYAGASYLGSLFGGSTAAAATGTGSALGGAGTAAATGAGTAAAGTAGAGWAAGLGTAAAAAAPVAIPLAVILGALGLGYYAYNN